MLKTLMMKQHKEAYRRPEVLETFPLPSSLSLLVQFSGEAEFGDFTDGGELQED